MAFQRDYVLRLIERMGEFFRRLCEMADDAEKKKKLDSACRDQCGLSLDAALKHEIDGWGCNIKEAMGGEVLVSFLLDGSKVTDIVFLYMA